MPKYRVIVLFEANNDSQASYTMGRVEGLFEAREIDIKARLQRVGDRINLAIPRSSLVIPNSRARRKAKDDEFALRSMSPHTEFKEE